MTENTSFFDKMIGERQVRPTALMPLWHIAGFALGAGTALLGEKAAMACTVAVEEVIDEHYKGQLDELGDDEKEIARFKSRAQLLKYWEENPDAKAPESSEEKKGWLDKEEDDDEDEEDS